MVTRKKKVFEKTGAAYVFSTLVADVKCVEWEPPQKGDDGSNLDRVPVARRSVVIKGGAGISNKNFITRDGTATPVTDEDITVLRQCPVFKQLEKNGFVKLSDTRAQPEQFAPDMEVDTGSSPLTPTDFTKDGDPTPSTGALPEE